MRTHRIAIVGATGLVGEQMRKVLEQRHFPVDSLRLFASGDSKGGVFHFRDEEIAVEELAEHCFTGVDIALFSAGSQIDRQFAPLAVREGSVVIDNSSAFRMDPGVPLVVPEVNPEEVRNHKGIIANPNCSTIQLVVVLHPLGKRAKIRRVVVTTFQSVSGAGRDALEELRSQVRASGGDPGFRGEPSAFPHPIHANLIPHIDRFGQDGYTGEELKIMRETQKILGELELKITATAVRVPVYYGHSEAVTIEFESKLGPEEAREILSEAPGVEVVDEPEREKYPLPLDVAGRDEVFVGRIRKDLSSLNGLNLWIAADNLRKGAATNAVQIAEELIK